MTKGKIDPVEEIRLLLQSADADAPPHVAGIFLDETLREFFLLDKPIQVPSIPASSIDHDNARGIIEQLLPIIPSYLAGHRYFEKRNPSSEEHSIHLGRIIPGRVMDFVHMLRLDFKFSANSGTIVSQGDSGRFPVYTTDRIYFKSRIVPVARGSELFRFDSLRLKDSVRVEAEETSRRLFTSVLFDDFSSREISIELSRKAGEIFNIPVTIYPMINYEYFTACLNVPDPSAQKLVSAVSVFEPLFVFLYSDMTGGIKDSLLEWVKILADSLEISADAIVMKGQLVVKMKDFFSGYTVSTNEELMLKGWRKIVS